MIAVAGIQDQELTVGAERPGIDDPAVGRRVDRGARPGRERNALRLAAEAVGSPKRLTSGAVDRQRQQALASAKATAGAMRSASPSEVGGAVSRAPLPWRRSPRSASAAARAAAAISLLHQRDQIAEAGRLLGKGRGLALFLGERRPREAVPRCALFARSGDRSAPVLGEGRGVGRGAGRARGSISARERDQLPRSAASFSAATRRSGTTAPSRMALRTAASASSGRTRIAGGGRRPMRCRAASTSASTPRRSPASARISASLLDRALSRRSVFVDLALRASGRACRWRSGSG